LIDYNYDIIEEIHSKYIKPFSFEKIEEQIYLLKFRSSKKANITQNDILSLDK